MIKFRLATERDSKKLFELRNDETVREASVNKEMIAWENHATWLSMVLKNELIFLYIVYNDQSPFIGQVRFDKKDKNLVEISVSVAKQFRGQGLGLEIIKKGVRFFLDNNPETKKVTGKIRNSNTASLYSFAKAGFDIVDKDKDYTSIEFKKI